MGLITLILKKKVPKHKPLPLRGIELFLTAVIEQAQPAILKKPNTEYQALSFGWKMGLTSLIP